MGPALMFAAASSALDLMGGLFGYLASGEQAAMAESRGRMIRNEAEAEAQRYAEQNRKFHAEQKLAYLKSGVQLSGSPLDMLDETARVASENLSSIRERGAAGELEQDNFASQARIGGRAALLSALSSATGRMASAGYDSFKAQNVANYDRKNIAP